MNLHFLFGASAKNKILFTRNFATMLRAGLSINETLEILANQAKGGFKAAIIGIIGNISSGRNLADSLADFPRYFSPFYLHTVRAGEKSGNLENNLLALG